MHDYDTANDTTLTQPSQDIQDLISGYYDFFFLSSRESVEKSLTCAYYDQILFLGYVTSFQSQLVSFKIVQIK